MGVERKRVVVCGSMVFMPLMDRIASDLEAMGVLAVVPDFKDAAAEFGTPEEWISFKRAASMAHFQKILDPATVGVVVANFTKHGVRSYVGPNSLAEIATAFIHGKKVWVIDGIPDSCADELLAWGAVDLEGDLGDILPEFPMPRPVEVT